MRLKLIVNRGSNSGKEFEVKVPQFVIGRAKGCQLRPDSEAISRQHCAICVTDDAATIRDLNSRNGTIVNGKATKGTCTLSDGDEIRIGPLYLRVSMEVSQDAKDHLNSDSDTMTLGSDETKTLPPSDSEKKKTSSPEAMPTQAMPALTSTRCEYTDSGDITAWLTEDVLDEISSANVETRRFRLDENEPIEIQERAEDENAEDAKKALKKKEPGKLPKPDRDLAADSKEAAEATLRKMFQRRL